MVVVEPVEVSLDQDENYIHYPRYAATTMVVVEPVEVSLDHTYTFLEAGPPKF